MRIWPDCPVDFHENHLFRSPKLHGISAENPGPFQLWNHLSNVVVLCLSHVMSAGWDSKGVTSDNFWIVCWKVMKVVGNAGWSLGFCCNQWEKTHQPSWNLVFLAFFGCVFAMGVVQHQYIRVNWYKKHNNSTLCPFEINPHHSTWSQLANAGQVQVIL